MNKAFAVILAFALVALFGCIQSPPSTSAGSFDKAFTFTAFTNNSTSDVFSLNTVLPTHAFSYSFTGTGWSTNGTNVSLQGSIDNVQWVELASVLGSANGTTFAVDKPVTYIRVAVTAWNATAGNATMAGLTVRYAGTG